MKKGYVLGAVAGACLLSGCSREPIEFTGTLKGYSPNPQDAEYALTFDESKIVSRSNMDSEGNKLECGDVYRVKGYEDFWGRHAKTVERLVDN